MVVYPWFFALRLLSERDNQQPYQPGWVSRFDVTGSTEKTNAKAQRCKDAKKIKVDIKIINIIFISVV